jgi:hypothetical protein
MLRKPKGYWDDFKNIENELRPLCIELGYMPSTKELERKGLNSLSRLGISKHGGVKVIAERLGFKTFDENIGRNSANYWTLENTISEFKSFLKKENLEHFPTRNEFKKYNRINLWTAIYNIGLSKFKNSSQVIELNLVDKVKVFLWNESKIIEKLLSVVDEIGFYPSSATLDKLGLTDLRGAITKNGGSQYYWAKLGEPKHENRKQKNRIEANDENYIEKEYLNLCSQLGHTASTNDIFRLEMHWLNASIRKKFGSIKFLIDKHNLHPENLSLIRANDDHLVRSINEAIFDNILCMLNVQHEIEGVIPGQINSKYLFDFKIKNTDNENVYVEIWGFNETKNNNKLIQTYLKNKEKKKLFYHQNNLNLIEIDGSFFNSPIKNIITYVKSKLSDANISFNQNDLHDNEIKTIIFKPYKVEDLVSDFDDISKSLGHYPSARDLIKLNRGELIDRISKIGGFTEIRKYSKLNLRSKVFEVKWTDETLLNELNILINLYGKIPTPSQLKALNRLDIFGALNKQGGIRKFAKKHNLKTTYDTHPTDFKDLNDIKAALSSLMRNDNKLPTISEIQSNGPSGLHTAIINYGGIVKVAIELGLELKYPQYTNIEYMKHVARLVIKEYGCIPPNKTLKQDFSSFVQAANRDYGGLNEIARIMNTTYITLRK